MTSICPNCKKTIRVGAKFCNHCGRPIPQAQSLNARRSQPASPTDSVQCPQCGAVNRAGAKFCAFCRNDLTRGRRCIARTPSANGPAAQLVQWHRVSHRTDVAWQHVMARQSAQRERTGDELERYVVVYDSAALAHTRIQEPPISNWTKPCRSANQTYVKEQLQ